MFDKFDKRKLIALGFDFLQSNINNKTDDY